MKKKTAEKFLRQAQEILELAGTLFLDGRLSVEVRSYRLFTGKKVTASTFQRMQ